MRNFAAVYTKEMRSYFVSPVAYVIAGVFLFLSGYLFRNILMQFNLWCLQFGQQAQMGMGGMPALNLNEMVITQFFAVMDFIWLLVIPMLTMRLFAEEKKVGHHRIADDLAAAHHRSDVGQVFCLLFALRHHRQPDADLLCDPRSVRLARLGPDFFRLL